MEHVTVKQIAEAVGGRLLCGNPDARLSHISIDSRSMKGEDLFVPLIGEKNDAHRFLDQAMANGATAALTSEHEVGPEGFPGALIRVEDTKNALQQIGVYLRGRLMLPLIGITGSVGKTTTREMVAAALSAGFRVFKTPANHNSQIGVPLTISAIRSEDQIGVLELGMSEPGEMTVISQIARVDMAIITNVGVTHIENLGTRENILREKLSIQDGMKAGGTVFLNKDNDLLCHVTAREGLETVYYGTGEDCDYRAEEIRLENGYPSFTMVHGERRVPVKLRVMGDHNVSNALAALAAADHCGVSLEAAAEKLYEFDGFQNRQQIYECHGITVIDDTYNASPDSMKAGIRVLASLTGQSRRIAVLADMKELGEESPKFHYEIGTFMAGLPIDEAVLYGELAGEIARGLGDALEKYAEDIPGGAGPSHKMRIVSFSENEKQRMTDYLETALRPGDAVLFKGSNSMKLGETAAHFIDTEQVNA